MPDQPMQTLVRHIRRMAGDEQDSEQSDRVLLAKFIAQRDENAFAALVQKHGPMVRGVCQRLLGQSPDVDDAFQATFLILVRKASAIRKADSLASWLYGVAYRIARGLRNRIARRELLERQPLPRSVDDPGMQAAWRELCMLLDEEVQRLADKYRAPLVLCYLEGQTRDQAARQLGCSLRTLDRRLTEGRERLRTRLARRGLTLSAGLLAVAMGEHMATAAVPSGLVDGTLQAAMLIFKGKRIAAAATGQVAVLVQEGLRAMFWTKLQAFTVFAVVAAGVATTGLILYTGGAPAQDRHSGQHAELPEAASDALGAAARDESGGQAMKQRTDPRQSASER